VLAQNKPLGDVGVAQSLRNKPEHLKLAKGQHRNGLS
jgi:hypothetical protein